MQMLRTALQALLFAVLAALGASAQEGGSGGLDRGKSRVIVLGFDGMDAMVSEHYMRGEAPVMPFLAGLAKRGTYEPMATTNPAQSPVAWAAMNSGVNPGKTGVFDFVARQIPDGDKNGRVPMPTLGLAKRGSFSLEDYQSSGFATKVAAGILLAFTALGLLLWLAARLGLPCRGITGGLLLGLCFGISVAWLISWERFDPWRSAIGGLALALVVGGAAQLLIGRRFVTPWPLALALLGLCTGVPAGLRLHELARQLPPELPAAERANVAPPFWKATSEAGIGFDGFQMAMTFPVEEIDHTRVLAGLGVPCGRLSFGDWFLYDETESGERQSQTAGFIYPLQAVRTATGATFRTKLGGPRNFLDEHRLDAQIAEIQSRISALEAIKPRGYKESVERNTKLEALREEKAKLQSKKEAARTEIDLEIRIPAPPALHQVTGRAIEALLALQHFTGGVEQMLRKNLELLGRADTGAWEALDVALAIEAALKGEGEGLRAAGKSFPPAAGELQRALDALRTDAERKAEVSLQGKTQRMAAREWSRDFYELSFVMQELWGPAVVKSDSITRAKVMSLYPMKLYVSPLNLDATKQPFHQNITYPRAFGQELTDLLGKPFETLGWACATHPLKDALIDEQTFLEDIEAKWNFRRELLLKLLETTDARVSFFLFGETDRVQHMFFRYLDTQHPLHAEHTKSTGKLRFFGETIDARDAIAVIYRKADELCREVHERFVAANPNAVMMVVSDHGFSSFRREFHLQNWLREKGYLVIKAEQEDAFKAEARAGSLFEGAGIFTAIDWEKTKAYSVGLGKVYLNRADREKWFDDNGKEHPGLVKPEECDALMDEISRGLLAERDADGKQVFRAIYKAKDIYRGDQWQVEADLYVGFQYGYRISWEASLGAMGLTTDESGQRAFSGPLKDNVLKWSGDHCSVDPSYVTGVFFSNRKLAVDPADKDYERPPSPANDPLPTPARFEEAPGLKFDDRNAPARVNLLHVAPTILDLVGVPVPAAMDRKPLRLR
ncbi:MAG: alkaline phosphatase family protein [Planctomycetes bacterium]|nr:alkaline phosphatase family protein [Planctomycetota bacterium]